jgi:hypothetical protein
MKFRYESCSYGRFWKGLGLTEDARGVVHQLGVGDVGGGELSANFVISPKFTESENSEHKSTGG